MICPVRAIISLIILEKDKIERSYLPIRLADRNAYRSIVYYFGFCRGRGFTIAIEASD